MRAHMTPVEAIANIKSTIPRAHMTVYSSAIGDSHVPTIAPSIIVAAVHKIARMYPQARA